MCVLKTWALSLAGYPGGSSSKMCYRSNPWRAQGWESERVGRGKEVASEPILERWDINGVSFQGMARREDPSVVEQKLQFLWALGRQQQGFQSN